MKSFFGILFLFITITITAQIPKTLTANDKVYGLSKFWQEVNYNFIYLDKVDRTMWDNQYKELISIVQNTKDDYEYYRELQKFCALLKDGHTNVYLPKSIEQMVNTFGDYKIFLKNIEGKAIIIRTNLSKKDEIPVGSEIIEVNGKPTQKFIDENVSPYISTSTNYVLQDLSISNLLKGLDGETFIVKIKKPNKKIIELALTHKKTEEKEVFPAEAEKQLLNFKWVNKETAYVSLNSFSDEKIDSLFVSKLPELYKAKSLIIDLRSNGGGSTNVGTEILQYLTNDTILYGSKQKSRFHVPAYKAWGKFVEAKDTVNIPWNKKHYLSYHDQFYFDFDYNPTIIELNAKRIVVPTVILFGHNTASAAEDFLILADNQKHMIKMGERSYGSTGQPFVFDLPGGGYARVCTKKDTYPDGREFVGYGIKPDIEVVPTLKDYMNNRDTALEEAIKYLKKR
ncbi:S41 family peptidase [Flavobacterium gelatinilyticum]|uniref:S41 family peptidase n=1 Tax=Flavobacterium gelatinilyticum TaxID=3003260 RepID=UPI002481031E|nr:S41 family peptidase [Flavobacterium gelatinilyticum]